MNNENFLSKYGLSVEPGSVKIGETYPIYGMITNIINDQPGEVLVEINFTIKAYLNLTSKEKVELIKRRSFDPAIFVSTIIDMESGNTVIDCHTVVFGKKADFDA